MLVSNCCGATPHSKQYAEINEGGICSDCKEDCLYISQEKFDEMKFGEICEECKGSGIVERTFGGSGWPEYDAPTICGDCDGTGRIKIPVETGKL